MMNCVFFSGVFLEVFHRLNSTETNFFCRKLLQPLLLGKFVSLAYRVTPCASEKRTSYTLWPIAKALQENNLTELGAKVPYSARFGVYSGPMPFVSAGSTDSSRCLLRPHRTPLTGPCVPNRNRSTQ